MTRLYKTHPILKLVNMFIVDSPLPSNISYFWNFGSLLGLCLVIQIVTGIILAMHYTPNINLAFESVDYIMRDVYYGWIVTLCSCKWSFYFFYMCIYTYS